MLPLKDNIPTDRFPVVTVVLIAINIVMFFGFQQARWADGGGFTVDEENVVEYAEIPYEITHPGKHCEAIGDPQNLNVACEGQEGVSGEAGKQAPTWLTVLTSMFMHGGLLHIAGNMLFLWIFGNNVEDSMGRAKFVAFYLLGGLAATAAHTLGDPSSAQPTLGASGAVAAVLGAYALLYPRARVVTLVFIVIFITVIELPAWLVLFGWAVLQVLSASSQVAGEGGVAYLAHIGGFIFGLAAIKLFATRQRDDYVEPRYPVY
ncbi:MAG TPA: rhomboid family intramembrane serine protease [Thermoleophilaceae bacterium]